MEVVVTPITTNIVFVLLRALGLRFLRVAMYGVYALDSCGHNYGMSFVAPYPRQYFRGLLFVYSECMWHRYTGR